MNKYNYTDRPAEGYWIYRDREYLLRGKVLRFHDLTDAHKDIMAVAIANSSSDAKFIVQALNEFSSDGFTDELDNLL